MSYSKRILFSKRCAIWCIIFGICITAYPILILNSFPYSLIFLGILVTISSINVINMNRRVECFSMSLFTLNFEDTSKEKSSNKRFENKEFFYLSICAALLSSIFVFTVVAVLFGAPFNEDFGATMYFSTLMTILSVYPLTLYYYFCDNVITVLKILVDNRLDTILENHLQHLLIWTAVGAWIGSFPIPLDWDRSWQKWPITCCIGAALGNASIHFVTGFKLFHSYYRDKQKVMFNRPV